MAINEQEYRSAIFSLQTFLLTYDKANKNTFDVYDEWVDSSNFIFTDKETMLEVLKSLEMMLKCPFDSLIVSAEIDLIPDYRTFLKYDAPPLF